MFEERIKSSALERAVVVSMSEMHIWLETERWGVWPLKHVGFKRELLLPCLFEGLQLDVLCLRNKKDANERYYSTKGLLESSLDILHDYVRPGDVYVGRVHLTLEMGAFVELLPGVFGFVHREDVSRRRVRDVRKFLTPGELVPVQVVGWSLSDRVLELSMASARMADAEAYPSLLPGGYPFEWTDELQALRLKEMNRSRSKDIRNTGHRDAPSGVDDALISLKLRTGELQGQVEKLQHQLDQRLMELDAAHQKSKIAQEQYEALRRKKSLRGPKRRSTRSDEDCLLRDAGSFLRAVRQWYAAHMDEVDRFRFPLRRMIVGEEFLSSVRALGEGARGKIVEVCAQVACEIALELESRQAHCLLTNGNGSGKRKRARDGARAWRCYLRQGPRGGQRLHWWEIDGPNGGCAEFANVVEHDEMRIAGA